MLVYNTNPVFLLEVQTALSAFSKLHLGLSSSLPQVSRKAFIEAKRCWINQRTHIRDRLIEDINQMYDEPFAIGETSTFVFLRGPKGKTGSWKKKIDIDQLQKSILFYMNWSDWPDTVKHLRDILPIVKSSKLWHDWEKLESAAEQQSVAFLISNETAEKQNFYESLFRGDQEKVSKVFIMPLIILGFFLTATTFFEAVGAGLMLLSLYIHLRIAGLVNKFGVFQ